LICVSSWSLLLLMYFSYVLDILLFVFTTCLSVFSLYVSLALCLSWYFALCIYYLFVSFLFVCFPCSVFILIFCSLYLVLVCHFSLCMFPLLCVYLDILFFVFSTCLSVFSLYVSLALCLSWYFVLCI
jgi:hypothetical protein